MSLTRKAFLHCLYKRTSFSRRIATPLSTSPNSTPPSSTTLYAGCPKIPQNTPFRTAPWWFSLVIGNFLRDGESNWLEGALFVIIYVIIAIASFYYPNPDVATSHGIQLGGTAMTAGDVGDLMAFLLEAAERLNAKV